MSDTIMTAGTLKYYRIMGRGYPPPYMQKLSSFTWGLVGFGLIILALVWPHFASSVAYQNVTPIHQNTARDAALDTYLSRLAWTYECVGACQKAQIAGEPFKIVDSNGLYSYGCLQFQQETYLRVAKKYKMDPWANGGIYNCDNQWALAKAMFEEDPKAASHHWETSIYKRGLGLPVL